MRYICVKQFDYSDCAVACLATISKYYGHTVSITKIRNITNTDIEGTSIFDIVNASETMGFTSKAVKGNEENFFSEFPLPAIAHIKLENGALHFIVIYKITKKYVIIADPAKGVCKENTDTFIKKWTGYLILIVPNNRFKKGNDNKGLFQRFLSLLYPQKRLLIETLLISIIITIFGILSTLYLQIVVDEIVISGVVNTLTIISISIIIIKILSVILILIRSYLLLYLSQSLDMALLLGYYEHILRLPINFFETRKVGDIISRNQDANVIRDALSEVALTMLIDLFMVIICGLVLLIKNNILFLTSIVIFVLYAILILAFSKSYKKANQIVKENSSLLNSDLIETINGIEIVKAFNNENEFQYKLEVRLIKLLKSMFKADSLTNIQECLKSFIELIGEVVIIWIGAYNVIKGTMTIGNLLSFNALIVYLLNPVKNIINLQPLLQSAIVASDRLGEILDLEVENKYSKYKVKKISINGDIKFSDVTFGYKNKDSILKNLNLTIKGGQKTAIIGKSGEGKSTIIKLLMKFHNVENGNISIGDYSIYDIDPYLLREKIAYVPQHTFLFSGTIYDNLTFGINNVDIQDVIKISKALQLHDFISKLPNRYETYIEENGTNLSGGQKQRLAIIRAILRKPEILILDESTSNLDVFTEKAIQSAIELLTNTTVIIIAHRISTVKKCDKICILNEGKIVESGNHYELLKNKKSYYYNFINA